MLADRRLDEIAATEPERDHQITMCIKAWHELGTTRGIGMAMGPIPVTAIYVWCDVEGFDREATMLMKNVIRLLDNDRAEREAAKAAADKARGKDRQ